MERILISTPGSELWRVVSETRDNEEVKELSLFSPGYENIVESKETAKIFEF